MDKHTLVTEDRSLQEKVAHQKIEVGLQGIERNLFELVDKVRKPQQKVRYLAQNWKQWTKVAMVGMAAVATVWIASKAIRRH